MALDPQARALIDAMPPIGKLSKEDLPAMRQNGEWFPIPRSRAPLVRREDFKIPGPGGPIPLRLYATSTAPGLPALVFYHGGGWTFGDLDSHDIYLSHLTREIGECAIVSVGYRLAPEHPFPAAFDDCYAAKEWIAANAAALGVDARRLAVGGDSAGGNLAAAVAAATRDRRGAPLIFQVLWYPPLDAACDTPSHHENAAGYLLTRDFLQFFWDCYVPDPARRSDPRCAPLHSARFDELPPTLVITAGFDPLRDEGRAYARRLRDAQVPAELWEYGDTVHGFAFMLGLLDDADAALVRVARRLAAAFRGRSERLEKVAS